MLILSSFFRFTTAFKSTKFVSIHAHFKMSFSHLISTTKLSELLVNSTPKLVVLDVSMPMPGETRDCHAEFQQRHIPGARFMDLQECAETQTDNDNMLPSKQKFTETVENLGIDSLTKVVVYDMNEKKGMFSSPRGWYVFRVFGHQEVYVLDGGLRKWLAEGKSVESGAAQPTERSQYKDIKYNPGLVKSLDDVKQNISDKTFQLLDARSSGRFNGTAPEPRAEIKPGHIPGAKCMFWTEFLEDGKYKSSDKLAELYKAAGMDPMAPHVASCGSGLSACFIALASATLGNPDVPVYDGSWMDWYLHAPNDLKINVPKD